MEIRKIALILGSGLLLGVLLGGMIVMNRGISSKNVTVGKLVDNIILRDMAGQTISFNQFKGKPLIISFWATWCVPCQEEMPVLITSAKIYQDQLNIIGINAQESENEVRKFMQDYQIPFPIVIDASGEVLRKFGVQGYPTTFLLDDQGILRDIHVGILRDETIKSYLTMLGVKP